MPEKISPEERLLSLTVALMASGYGLTKETILSTVSGYREKRDEGTQAVALEKMFERDKESLRDLGIPIETLGDLTDPDDLREARYRIPKSEYVLPEDITFTPAEIAVLNLAGAVWGESSLSDAAQGALRKIRALGIDVDEPIIGFSPRVNVRDPAFAALTTASDQARVVRFTYVKPGDDVARLRRVQPLALVEFEGRWHVMGKDLDLGAERTFLLSRISGPVQITKDSFDRSLRTGAGERALAGLEAVAASNTAELVVRPGTEAALRLQRRADRAGDALLVPFVDIHVLADELASFGPEVFVVAPQALRAEVIARLERAHAAHVEEAS